LVFGLRVVHEAGRDHEVFRLGVFAFSFCFLSQVDEEVFAEVCAAGVFEDLGEELFVFLHEFVDFVGRGHQIMLEAAVFGLVALARAVEILAWEVARVVREVAVGAAMAVVGQKEFAELARSLHVLLVVVVRHGVLVVGLAGNHLGKLALFRGKEIVLLLLNLWSAMLII
jgi:hypothetical protein